MSKVSVAVRCILSVAILYGVYLETGTCTAIMLTGLYIGAELQNLINAKLREKITGTGGG